MSNILLDTAEILEKLAAYVDGIESQKQEVSAASARSLAEKVSESLGHRLDVNMINKIAQADPDMVNLLAQLTQSGDSVDSLGGPATPTHSTKVAGSGDMGAAEASLMDWLRA